MSWDVFAPYVLTLISIISLWGIVGPIFLCRHLSMREPRQDTIQVYIFASILVIATIAFGILNTDTIELPAIASYPILAVNPLLALYVMIRYRSSWPYVLPNLILLPLLLVILFLFFAFGQIEFAIM